MLPSICRRLFLNRFVRRGTARLRGVTSLEMNGPRGCWQIKFSSIDNAEFMKNVAKESCVLDCVLTTIHRRRSARFCCISLRRAIVICVYWRRGVPKSSGVCLLVVCARARLETGHNTSQSHSPALGICVNRFRCRCPCPCSISPPYTKAQIDAANYAFIEVSNTEVCGAAEPCSLLGWGFLFLVAKQHKLRSHSMC